MWRFAIFPLALGIFFRVSHNNAVGTGCFQVPAGLAATYDLSSSTACNGRICPTCFIATGTSALSFTACPEMRYKADKTIDDDGLLVEILVCNFGVSLLTVTPCALCSSLSTAAQTCTRFFCFDQQVAV